MSEIPYSVRSSRGGGQAIINNITGLDWTNVSNNEMIRKKDDVTAEGAGMTVTDNNAGFNYKKLITFFNRASPLTFSLGLIEYSFDVVSTIFRTHISPKSTHSGTANGLFLKATQFINNVKVGINQANPAKELEVGTTLIVDDLNKRVGINQANPSVDLEVLNTMYVDSNTRRVGVISSGVPTATFQVGDSFYVNQTTQSVGVNKATPEEHLDINGKLRIEESGTQTIRFYDTQGGGTPDENGRIEVDQDGGGGEIKFYTLETGGGTPQERLSINRHGAIGIGGANYGGSGQVLTSNEENSAVSWTSLPPAPLSKVYGTSYLTNDFVNYPTGGVYQSIAGGTWASYGTPSHADLFPHNGTELVKFPRVGTYNISVSCQTLGNHPGNDNRILKIQTKVPSGSWVDIKTHDYLDGFGTAGDVVYKYTNVINFVLEITIANTTLTALIFMSNSGRIDGDITGNTLQQKPTSISVFNVD